MIPRSLVRAAALAAALCPAALPAQGPMAAPLPACAWTQGPCSSYRVEVATREIWRGYSGSSGAAFLPSASVGVLGYPRLTIGRWGVSLDVRGRVPFEGGAGADPGASGAVLLHHRLSPAPEAARFALGVRGWAGDAPLPGVDGEVVAGVGFPEVAVPFPEQAMALRIEGARTFGDTEGTYARAILHQPVPFIRLGERGGGFIGAAIEVGASVSDLPGRSGGDRDFGYHAAEATLRLEWQRAERGTLPLTAGLDLGGAFPDDDVGASRGWASLWLALQP